MKVELKKIKIHEDMSEETTCFNAEIYIDGINVGTTSNDGRGGCTDYHSYPGFYELFRNAEAHLASMPNIVYPADEFSGELSIKCTFENWIDFQVSEFQKAKDERKAEQKLAKDMLKGICYGSKRHYTLVWWKNYTLNELLNSPVGKALIQKTVNQLKADGKVILNTNLLNIEL